MDALEILQSDHEQMRSWIEQVKKTPDLAQKLDLYELIREALEQHIQVEEAILYPVFIGFDDLTDFLDEFYEEHQEVQDLMDEIDETIGVLEYDDEDIGELVDELADALDHHVSAEEEFFVRARELLTPDLLDKIGEEILDAKRAQSRAA